MSTTPAKMRLRSEDPLAVLRRGLVKLYSVWVSAMYPFAAAGKNLSIHPSCRIDRSVSPYISLGSNVTLHKDVWINVVVEDAVEEKIMIEDGVSLGVRSTISARNRIKIGKNVITGPSVLIQDHQHEFNRIDIPIKDQGVTVGGRITIEDGCWIGQGAVIVCSAGELVVGRNSVIGANTVVTKSVSPHSVVAGNPARLLRQYDSASGQWRRVGTNISEEGTAHF